MNNLDKDKINVIIFQLIDGEYQFTIYDVYNISIKFGITELKNKNIKHNKVKFEIYKLIMNMINTYNFYYLASSDCVYDCVYDCTPKEIKNKIARVFHPKYKVDYTYKNPILIEFEENYIEEKLKDCNGKICDYPPSLEDLPQKGFVPTVAFDEDKFKEATSETQPLSSGYVSYGEHEIDLGYTEEINKHPDKNGYLTIPANILRSIGCEKGDFAFITIDYQNNTIEIREERINDFMKELKVDRYGNIKICPTYLKLMDSDILDIIDSKIYTITIVDGIIFVS